MMFFLPPPPQFMDCFMIGRDLVRLLQNVARIPEFEQLWKDIIHNPQVLSTQFTGGYGCGRGGGAEPTLPHSSWPQSRGCSQALRAVCVRRAAMTPCGSTSVSAEAHMAACRAHLVAKGNGVPPRLCSAGAEQQLLCSPIPTSDPGWLLPLSSMLLQPPQSFVWVSNRAEKQTGHENTAGL